MAAACCFPKLSHDVLMRLRYPSPLSLYWKLMESSKKSRRPRMADENGHLFNYKTTPSRLAPLSPITHYPSESY
jgi:hypothetical protein